LHYFCLQMDLHVPATARIIIEWFCTNCTLMRLLSCMDALMSLHMRFLREFLLTVWTTIWLFTSVDSVVSI
jgi:hypothetical protein